MPLGGPTASVSGLHFNTTYYAQVRAVNHNGISTEFIQLGSTLTLPGSVDIIEVTYNFGGLFLNTSTVSASGLTVTNDGGTDVTYELRVTTLTVNSPWYPSTDLNNGFNKFTVQGLFHPVQPSHEQFSAEDLIEEMPQSSQTLSEGGRYTVDNTQTGVSVPAGESRTLWLRFFTPLSTSTTDVQQIKISVFVRTPEG